MHKLLTIITFVNSHIMINCIDEKSARRSPEHMIDYSEAQEIKNYKYTEYYERYYDYQKIWTITNVRDYTIQQDRRSLVFLMRDCMSDARYKRRQTDGLRHTHRKELSFEVGYAFGLIREKYREMAEIYRLLLSSVKHKNFLLIQKYTEEDFVNRLEEMTVINMDIDKLLDIIELLPIRNLKSPNQDGTRRAARTVEQAIKRDYRREFLMKKMGRPLNGSTTARRFINKWPVEETWDMYNDEVLNS